MPLSNESRLPYFAVHACEWVPEEGTQVVCKPPKGAGHWTFWLHLFKEAAESDLEEGKADYVGEFLEYREYEIRHCPFCGVHLRSELPHEYQT